MEYWNVGILGYKSGYYLILCSNLVEFFIIISDHANLFFLPFWYDPPSHIHAPFFHYSNIPAFHWE